MNTLTDAPDLADFVAEGWNLHAERPRDVASGLLARAASLCSDAAGADAINLAEHVWLSHLQDEAGLQAFLHAVTPTEPSTDPGAAWRRAQWALGTLAAQPPSALPDLPPGARWRALQNVWTPMALRGHAAQVRSALTTELPLAMAHADAAMRRGLAATCNNMAVELRTGRREDAELDALMLDLASASRALWGSAGTWVHAERAEYQLARCHAVLGKAAAALRHAQACLAIIDANAAAPEADAFERFFAHEALAWAHRVAGDAAAAAEQRAHMATRWSEITDTELRAWAAQAAAEFDGPTLSRV
jgi:hypothetical protein